MRWKALLAAFGVVALALIVLRIAKPANAGTPWTVVCRNQSSATWAVPAPCATPYVPQSRNVPLSDREISLTDTVAAAAGPTPPPGTLVWQAGNATLGRYFAADPAFGQCGTPSVVGTSFMFPLTFNSNLSCYRNQAMPSPDGTNSFVLTDGVIYAWQFHFIDGNRSDVAPRMGYDTDARSLIWQVHTNGGTGNVCLALGFDNGGTIGAAQQWFFNNDCIAAHGEDQWVGTYTPGETDDWTVYVKVSTTSAGWATVYRNGSQVYTATGANYQNIGTTGGPWWNFGVYKWMWETGATSLSSVNETTNNMSLYSNSSTPGPSGCNESNYTLIVNGQSWPLTFCPYSIHSPYKTALPASPATANVDSTNTTNIRQLASGSGDGTWFIAEGRPAYAAKLTDHLVTVNCSFVCSNFTSGSQIRVPSPPNGIYTELAGSDDHMAVIQPNGDEIDLYGFSGVTTPHIGNITTYNVAYAIKICGNGSITTGCGSPPNGILGYGVPEIATTDLGAISGGEVRWAEMTEALNNGNASLHHAFIFTGPCAPSGGVYPGQSLGPNPTDVPCHDGGSVPMGALVFNAMTDAQVDATSMPGWQKVLAKTIHHYGMYFSDLGGNCVSNHSCGLGGIIVEGSAVYSAYGTTDPHVAFGNTNCGNSSSCDLTGLWQTIGPHLEVLNSCYAQQSCSDSLTPTEPPA